MEEQPGVLHSVLARTQARLWSELDYGSRLAGSIATQGLRCSQEPLVCSQASGCFAWLVRAALHMVMLAGHEPVLPGAGGVQLAGRWPVQPTAGGLRQQLPVKRHTGVGPLRLSRVLPMHAGCSGKHSWPLVQLLSVSAKAELRCPFPTPKGVTLDHIMSGCHSGLPGSCGSMHVHVDGPAHVSS